MKFGSQKEMFVKFVASQICQGEKRKDLDSTIMYGVT